MRSPVVADRFYPGSPSELRDTLHHLVPDVPAEQKQQALAAISPHAGYVYSGGVAGETIGRIQVPDTVVILGPNHHGHGDALALGTEDWQMVLGDVAIDRELARQILDSSRVITEDITAHAYEHSLEVQVPFLQYCNSAVKIVPIVVSHVSYDVCVEAADDLASAIRNYSRPVMLLASTDMTHYESRREAGRKDHLALERIEAMDPRGLYDTVIGNRISMCGIMPTTITLLTAISLGAKEARLVRYTDSGEASGDTAQVVGYAGMIIR
ncbi:MAG: AmmeMemoRadiSam system protein B [Desulfobulbaceae bacterium]|nr:AmmeMemoRadiSam system protein B [Desulfobulbaceae bacterium]